MISVGGFGHSGNTALLDMIVESTNVCPLANRYTETAIIRGKWGFRGILNNLDSKNESIPWEFIEDCLVGDIKPEHASFNPPTTHDFKRNKNVQRLLGAEYTRLVIQLIKELSENIDNISDNRVSDLLVGFLSDIQSLAITKSGDINSIPVIRNDPDAAGISMLKYSNCNVHFVTYRNVFDMMYDWVTYYKHGNNLDGATLFTKQYKRKINNFCRSVSALSPDIRVKIKAVCFEKLITDQDFRSAIFGACNLEVPKQYTKFDPSSSIKNIGIGDQLDSEAYELCKKECKPVHDKLVSYIEENKLLINE